MEYAFIDPLKLAIRRVILYSTYPLSTRVSFSSREDIKEISAIANKLIKSHKTPLLWMSPVLDPNRVRPFSNIPEAAAIACVVDESRLEQSMKSVWKALKGLPVFFYDSTGTLRAANDQARDSQWNELVNQNVHSIRKEWRDFMLNPLLEEGRKHKDSGKPIELPSKRLVREWIDMKPVLQDPENAFSIAYELGFLLSNGYQDELKGLDAFACSNNTGLILASLLGLIFSKELIIIDRAGPLPRFSTKTFPEIVGLKICLVEETIATGREVDLASLFIQMKGATLTEVITVCKIGSIQPVVAQRQDVPMRFLCRIPDTTVCESQRASGPGMSEGTNA